MERDTIKIETPVNKVSVELIPWLNGAEKRKLSSVDQHSMDGQSEMIKTMVKKIGDHTEPDQIIAELDKMHGKDFDFVLVKMLDVVKESSYEVEKKSN